MITRRALAAAIAVQKGISPARAYMLVNIVCAELELPAGALSERAAGEVELIVSRKP